MKKRPAHEQAPSHDDDEHIDVKSIDELWRSELGVTSEEVQQMKESRSKRARAPSRNDQ